MTNKGGRPKGAPNKKKVLKIEDFVRDNNINVAETWWAEINKILNPKDKVLAIQEFYKYVGGLPKATGIDEEKEIEKIENADVLSIVNGSN